MSITLYGLLVNIFFFFFIFRGRGANIVLMIAVLPIGAGAVLNLPGFGDSSVTGPYYIAALLVGVKIFVDVFGRHVNLVMSDSKVNKYILFILVYGWISAFVFPFIFEGDFNVFSTDRSKVGIQISDRVLATVVPLEFGGSNVVQYAYFFLSFILFKYLTSKEIWFNARLFHKAFVVAAVVNIIFGFFDLFGLDSVLQFFRTANYDILDSHKILGFSRLIGGAPEASAFGALSVVFCSYFYFYCKRKYGILELLLFLFSFVFSIASLSSTAYFGIFVLLFFALIEETRNAFSSRNKNYWRIIRYLSLSLAVPVFYLLIYANGDVRAMLDELIFGKSESLSALERGLWAEYGYKAFLNTYGLGAGIGSIRANGWLSVSLGSYGLLGTLALLAFYFHCVKNVFTSNFKYDINRLKSKSVKVDDVAVVMSAGLTFVILFLMGVASRTSPNPGVLTVLILALCYNYNGKVK